jgi:hypothetical protein
MLRVVAFIDQVLRRAAAGPDLNEHLVVLVLFTEMGAQAALSFMNGNHDELLPDWAVKPYQFTWPEPILRLKGLSPQITHKTRKKNVDLSSENENASHPF